MRISDWSSDVCSSDLYRLSDMSQTAIMKLPKYELANEIHWISDTQLVYVKGGKWGAREEPYDFGEIIAMDYDGKRYKYLYGWKEPAAALGIDRKDAE